MADIFNMTDTWNDGGTDFDAIKMNVTDTASGSGSKLLNLQVGGVSQFFVKKSGGIQTTSLANTANQSSITGWIFETDGNGQKLRSTSGQFSLFNQTGISVYASSKGLSIQGYDCWIARDDANQLALRNGLNAQSFSVYNTYTDGSNYERGVFKFSSNLLKIITEAAGSGTARAMEIIAGGSYINLGAGGSVKFGIGSTFVSSYVNLVPSNNNGKDLGGSATVWRQTFSNKFSGLVSSAGAPTTTELPNDKDWCIHKNTSSSAVVLAYNDGGSIKTVALS